MSSPNEIIISTALRDFEKALQLSIPFSRLSDFHDEAVITKVGQHEKRKILEEFMKNISDFNGDKISELLRELDTEVQKLMKEYQTKNAEHRMQSERFIEQVGDFLFKEFESHLNSNLKLDPHMELDSLRSVVCAERKMVMSHFLDHWKPGNAKFRLVYRTKLMERLEDQSRSIEQKQAEFLNSRAIAEARENVLKKCEQFECDKETGKLHFKTDEERDLLAQKVEKARALLNKPDLSLEEILDVESGMDSSFESSNSTLPLPCTTSSSPSKREWMCPTSVEDKGLEITGIVGSTFTSASSPPSTLASTYTALDEQESSKCSSASATTSAVTKQPMGEQAQLFHVGISTSTAATNKFGRTVRKAVRRTMK